MWCRGSSRRTRPRRVPGLRRTEAAVGGTVPGPVPFRKKANVDRPCCAAAAEAVHGSRCPSVFAAGAGVPSGGRDVDPRVDRAQERERDGVGPRRRAAADREVDGVHDAVGDGLVDRGRGRGGRAEPLVGRSVRVADVVGDDVRPRSDARDPPGHARNHDVPLVPGDRRGRVAPVAVRIAEAGLLADVRDAALVSPGRRRRSRSRR